MDNSFEKGGNILDKIDFDALPDAFVIKCSHGCKWQYIIKDKNAFLQNKRLYDLVGRQMQGWMEQEYWPWGGFEMQYSRMKSKPSIKENDNSDE